MFEWRTRQHMLIVLRKQVLCAHILRDSCARDDGLTAECQ
jgi:hypothetical protein